ncbi:Lrp/AsnC family transcriptional regulator [Fluviibacterium sp. DFM31]|uniref:Lrp/AsnC family transcriptional regulator n=1 Tax=Meridianimarinicoccus marinus TaxID=3231483 RepID=A0ABV3L4M7_9RHOB
MDIFDRRILRALQKDSQRPIAELARDIGLSTSACHRRIKLLEENGLIRGYAAQIDRTALGLKLQVFVEITLSSQAREVLEAFETAVTRFDDILECHLTSGHADYILRVVARDMNDYADIHRECLSRLPNVASMQTIFTLRPVQQWRGYPIRDAD